MSGTHSDGIQSNPPSGFTPVGNIFTVDFTADLGTVVTLNGLTPTQAITGLLTTDQVLVQCLGALPTGIAIGGARCSVNGTLAIRFVTSVVGNVALGKSSKEPAKVVVGGIEVACLVAELLGPFVGGEDVGEDVRFRQIRRSKSTRQQRLQERGARALRAPDQDQSHHDNEIKATLPPSLGVRT